jgi:glucosylceramidase
MLSVRRLVAAALAAPVAALALGVAPAMAAPLRSSNVQVVMTTADLAWHLTRLPDLRLSAGQTSGVPVIHVDDSVRYQHYRGVGGAMTDSSAWLIYDELDPTTRSRVMNSLFGRDGLDLNFVRVPMGASDFTVAGLPYTYDDLPAGQTDPTLSHFSVAHDALNNLKGSGHLLPSAWGPLADYFVKFIQSYASLGVPVDEITPQNEPQGSSGFPGLNLPASDEAQFITRDLVPALRAARLHPKIYGFDRGAILPYAQALVASTAHRDLAGIAWHCYGGSAVMSALHLIAPALDEIVSECSPGLVRYAPAEAIISSLDNWASTVGLWNLALDPSGGPVEPPNLGCPACTGIVTVDEQTHAVTYNLNYYQLGQVSKFVAPGAVRIGSDRLVTDFRMKSGAYGVTPGLDDVALRNPDGSTVLIAYDNSAAWTRFGVQENGRSFLFALPPWATATFSWRG